MKANGKLNLGIVGACGRGASFRSACDAHDEIHLKAICDINREGLEQAKQTLGAEEAYVDYSEMLEKSGIDAVIVGTPMPHHVPQSIMALERGIHVLSEVPSAVTLEECRALHAAVENSDATYMLAENYIYRKNVMIITEMVRRGLFGVPYYAEGEYIHELKDLNVQTPWRRVWQTGINGITYGTHSLGPILHWMQGDRVKSVTCSGSGHHYRDPDGKLYENEDSCVMLCKTERDALIKIRVDMLSDRPHAANNHILQGTEGSFESARYRGGENLLWLKSRRPNPKDGWEKLEEIENLDEEYLPEVWKVNMEKANNAGHGGGDFIEILQFVDAIMGRSDDYIDIHKALDMTMPGLVSQQSIAQGGKWLEVPNSREWSVSHDREAVLST